MNDDVMICFKPMSKHRSKSGIVKTISYSTNIPLDIDYNTARKIIDYFTMHSLENVSIESITDDVSGNRYCFTISTAKLKNKTLIEEVNIPIIDILI